MWGDSASELFLSMNMSKEQEMQVNREMSKESELESISYKPNVEMPESYKGVLLTPEQFNSVISYAETARDLEKRTSAVERLHISEEMIRNGIPVDGVYRYAKDMLGIEQKFIDKAMKIFYPSVEQKLEDISKYNAKPEYKAIVDDYTIELNRVIKENLLDDNIRLKVRKTVDERYRKFKFFYEYSIKKRIPFTNKHISFKRKRKLGIVQLWSDRACWIDVHDLMFLPLFGEKLEKLSERWGGKNEFKYNYNPYRE